MESSLNPHDELRRLQDKVRKLELQNEQLRSQQFSKNGFEFEIKSNILSSFSEIEYYRNRLESSGNHNWEDELLKPEELRWENSENEETWLCKPKNDCNIPTNLRRWIRQDADNQNDHEVQSIRRKLLDKIEELEQAGSRRNFIDSRTFTRPKRRVPRPGLDVMSERPILENQHVSPWKSLISKQMEMIDDVSMNLEYTLSLGESDLISSLNKEAANLNSTFLKVASETKSIMSPIDHHNSTYVKLDEEMIEQTSSDSERSVGGKKPNQSLNTTFVKEIPSPLVLQNITRIKNISTNSAPSHPDNNRGRAASCDSVADEDQLSSASDSSYSSTTRLMNVGDVQTIARLQEESLKQLTSTPKQNSRDNIVLESRENTFSPIRAIMPETHQGYLSDHSDHSSAEGRARSSRSSVRSSPAVSPYGSTSALANEFLPPPMSMAQRRGGKVTQPAPTKHEALKPQPGAKLPGAGQRRVMSGLRPPSVRSGIPSRPSTAGSSNIPRPASRIPAPRVRSSYASQQTAPKADWMDGCY